MIVHDAVQGSAEWHALRYGALTASRAGELFTPEKLQISKSRDKLMAKLLHEWITGSPCDDISGRPWVVHGQQLEPAAAAWFEDTTGEDVRPVGFIARDESATTGCSPDLWCSDRFGVELKCPAGWTHIAWKRAGGVPREHVLQVQFSLWVTGLPRWFWMSYAASPLQDGFLPTWEPGSYMAPHLVEVTPEARYQDAFDEHVPAFIVEMMEARLELRRAGFRPAMEVAA